MILKTPKFWQKRNLIAVLLLPLSAVYLTLFVVVNFFRKVTKANIPVVCVGNVVAGGSGKTPVAIAIGKILRDKNVDFAYLTRGYGADFDEVFEIDEENSLAKNFGDEPLLLKEISRVFVAKNRAQGARKIEKDEKIQAIILDDGMQNKNLQKDFVIMVVDGKIKFGNGFLIPAGPLRQSVKSGITESDLVVVVGEIDEELSLVLADKIAKNQVAQAKIKALNIEEFEQKKLLAFCGLAYPEKFFSYLEDLNFDVKQKISFCDHYDYEEKDLCDLILKAKEQNLKLVTTKKDWVKFDEKYRKEIDFLDIELEFTDKNLVEKSILSVLK